jgi:hypothetical protein
VPDEAEVQALLEGARATRKKPSRELWIFALAVSVVCVVALSWGVINYWDAPPEQKVLERPVQENGSGFGLGLAVGIGVGIAIGSVLALRRRQS